MLRSSSIIINIERGDLIIDDTTENIKWTMQSKSVFSELNVAVNEGDLILLTKKSNIQDRFDIEIALDYAGFIDLTLVGNSNIVGRHNLVIRNTGDPDTDGDIDIEIRDI